MRDRFTLAASVFVVAASFVLFVLAGIYTIRQQHHVNSQLCESAVSNRAAIRTTWQAAHRILLSSQETDEGRQAINRLFEGILEVIPPLRCEDSNPVPKEG